MVVRLGKLGMSEKLIIENFIMYVCKRSKWKNKCQNVRSFMYKVGSSKTITKQSNLPDVISYFIVYYRKERFSVAEHLENTHIMRGQPLARHDFNRSKCTKMNDSIAVLESTKNTNPREMFAASSRMNFHLLSF